MMITEKKVIRHIKEIVSFKHDIILQNESGWLEYGYYINGEYKTSLSWEDIQTLEHEETECIYRIKKVLRIKTILR